MWVDDLSNGLQGKRTGDHGGCLRRNGNICADICKDVEASSRFGSSVYGGVSAAGDYLPDYQL